MNEPTRLIRGDGGTGGTANRWRLPDMGAFEETSTVSEAAPPMPSVEEIERLQAEARREAAEQGRREGYEAGFTEGRDAGLQQGEAEIRARANQLSALLDSLAAPAAELDDAVEAELAELSLAVARQVIRRELITQPGEVIAVLREAMALLPLSSRELRVRVHQDDAALLREQGVEGDWRIEEDPGMSRGGCLIDTATSHIDASLEHRIAAVASSLLGDQRGGGANEAENASGPETHDD